MPGSEEVLSFWFDELEVVDWWRKSLSLDQQITDRFLTLHSSAIHGELWRWRDNAKGRLAEIIVLDQFSRNIYRDTPSSFASDPQALTLAQEAVSLQLDLSLPIAQRAFLYMPYMHSESLLIHHQAERLFAVEGLESNAVFEQKHKVIIERFGRYPHRNALLGRTSTKEELSFLQQPSSSF